MTWKIITPADLKGIEIVGKMIAHAPEDEETYEVKSVNVHGYVTAIHSNEKVVVKVFPEEKLLKETWWIKK